MVSQQATQTGKSANSTDWATSEGDDSVRITAADVPPAVVRQILRAHYEKKLARQQAVVTLERGIRNSNASGAPMYTQADLRVSNTIAVLQDISATLKSFGDDNRDF